MNDDQTKINKPNPNLNPQPRKSFIDLSSHPDAIEAGLGKSPSESEPSSTTSTSSSPVGAVPDLSSGKKGDKPKKPRRSPIQWFKDLSKKKKILLIVVVLLLLVGGTVSAMILTKKEPVPEQAAVEEPPKPTTEASKLTGVQVEPALNKRSITAVMIENSLDARPQSGLTKAGVVFEAIAEGGITRFLTLFQEGQPANIGPVRSVRPYYVDWLQGFDAAVAHAGGSTEALIKIKQERVKDLDQFFNPVAYRREASRYAPHNLYTSTVNLDKLKKQKSFTSTNFDGFPRKEEQPSKTPTAKTISFNISGIDFNPSYKYIPSSNTYARSIAGKPQTDLNNNKQIKPKVVIAMVMNYGIAPNGVNSQYNTIGKGKVYIFQDGNVTIGTWEKTGRKKQITFMSDKGTIKLNPGSTWISAVGAASDVTYK